MLVKVGVVVLAVVVGGAALVLGLKLAARLGGGSEADDQLVGTAPAGPGVLHVHALGVNPADGLLYVATHTGLFRVDGEEMSRVAGRFQDTMGFTVLGPDRFLASGHPDPREDLPGRLGLIESVDAGQTWRPVSLEGEADLHAIAQAPDVLYAADATTGRLLASGDEGVTWERRAEVELGALAVDPADPARLAGLDYDGGLLASVDGGATWEALAGPRLASLAWPPGALVGLADDGVVHAAPGPEGSWAPIGRIDGGGAALTADAGRLSAATDAGALFSSDDGGRTWVPEGPSAMP